MKDTVCACVHWYEEHEDGGGSCFAPGCSCESFSLDPTLNTPEAIAKPPKKRKKREPTWVQGNLPRWSNDPEFARASAVYSRAYRLMEQRGADVLLIDALNDGDEEAIKANMRLVCASGG